MDHRRKTIAPQMPFQKKSVVGIIFDEENSQVLRF